VQPLGALADNRCARRFVQKKPLPASAFSVALACRGVGRGEKTATRERVRCCKVQKNWQRDSWAMGKRSVWGNEQPQGELLGIKAQPFL